MPRRKSKPVDNLIASARKFKSFHPDFKKYSERKSLKPAEKKKLRATLRQFANISEKYGAGGFKILRTKRAVNRAKAFGLTIGKFNVIKLNSYIDDSAPIRVSSGGKVVTQTAVHKYNSHMRKWHFHKVDFQKRIVGEKKGRTDLIVDAFERELNEASRQMKKEASRKCIGIFLWGPLGILYNHNAASIPLFLDHIRSWLNASVSGRTLDTDNLLGFAWASHPCDKPITFPNSPKRTKNRATNKKGRAKKWKKPNASGRN